MTSPKKTAEKATEEAAASQQNTRETVESIIIAFILAFLFRAFVAEAFVIPTGSMAPTLMGAHKDIFCEYCGAPYQSTASFEFNQETGRSNDRTAISSTCSVCRAENAFDLRGNGNHATFSGDRILVSKFDYLFHDPARWDVLVFKFPDDARMNYIKRLVGLPGEHLMIREGDVYTRKQASEPWQIARKPPHKIRAMSQVVSDTAHLSEDMIESGWPSLWQPWPRVDSKSEKPFWNVQQTAKSWSAELAANAGQAGETRWLRYFHQVLDQDSWRTLASGEKLPSLAAYNVNLITDYLAYNTTKQTSRGNVYDRGRLRPEITSQRRALDLVNRNDTFSESAGLLANDGLHWVGDLAVEFDVEVTSDSGSLSVDLVEFGIHYRCTVDVATGSATLEALDGSTPINAFGGQTSAEIVKPRAATGVKGAGRYALRFANFDDRIAFWVNGSLVKFDSNTDFDSHGFRAANSRKPHWTEGDPLDAAPIGIGGQGVALKVHRAQVWRDIYYIAIDHGNFTDFNLSDGARLTATIPDPSVRNEIMRSSSWMERSLNAILATYSSPEWWAESTLFDLRGEIKFELMDDHFFPMGDNSAASSDARCWSAHHYVERRYLIGKALLVFWPHYWRSPIPFFPNFARMRLIR